MLRFSFRTVFVYTWNRNISSTILTRDVFLRTQTQPTNLSVWAKSISMHYVSVDNKYVCFICYQPEQKHFDSKQCAKTHLRV